MLELESTTLTSKRLRKIMLWCSSELSLAFSTFLIFELSFVRCLLNNFSTPGGNSIAACELTCLLIAALARPICPAAQSMREDRWDRKLYSGTELYGKTLAILGLGRIGREVAIRMKTWGMEVIGYDPITTAAEAQAAGIKKMELVDIWPLADYITVHVPLLASTRSENFFELFLLLNILNNFENSISKI